MPHYDFVQNKECEFYPCHKGADPETFSCLFCYCPLYALGDSCGGAFTYLENGIKDCSACLKPHRRENYGAMMEKMGEVLELAKRNRKGQTMLFCQFPSQQERRAYGGSDFVALAFCKGSGNMKALLKTENLPLWKNDSLYVPDVGQEPFRRAYRDILGDGCYGSGRKGPVDLCGVNYYTAEDLGRIISRVRERRPQDWETLLPWLEEAEKYNGFYILGL